MTRRATLQRLSLTATALVLLALVLAPEPAAAQRGFGRNKIRYQDFKWEIYHSPHFDVYYYPEEERLLQKVVSYAESAYDELSQKFDFKIQDATPLIFYETHSAFEQNNIILNFIPEGIGAFASSVRNRMVLPVDLPGPELMELILHELTHIFEYHMLFGANLGKGVASSPPQWFMEGLASYMAEDEGAREKMFLRDAVVNDRIPSIAEGGARGFFAYRFGHAVFEFIEERWGPEGIRDFMIESRNTLGGRMGRALERSFGMDPEDFDSEFRRWLRKKYLPELIETGEPADFGRPFRRGKGPVGIQTSPAASPSGDLLVAFNTREGQVDIMLFDTRKREVLRNLTTGYDKEFQYIVAQELTLGRKMGRDLAFSPDGNQVAFFARRERGRSLVILDVLDRKIVEMIDMEIEQQIAPAWSADGRSVAFGGHRDGQFDIYAIDLSSREVKKITDDEIYDAAPVYSPDGKSLVMSSVVGGYAKLFRVDLANPSERYPVTYGESNDIDAVYSADGSRIYFTSDRSGANNIYSVDLESGSVAQHTNSVTGCFTPTVLPSPDGGERLVFTSFWKGRFDLYLLDVADPITEPILLADTESPGEALSLEALPQFEPSIEVSIDDSNRDTYGGFKFFIEDVGGTIGVSDDQTFIGATWIQLSDFLGDRRIFASFQSIESFQNFDVVYADLSHRWQWTVRAYDDRDFFVTQVGGFRERSRRAIAQTGVVGSVIYPINVSHRFEVGLGYNFRELDFFSFVQVPLENLTTEEVLNIVDFPDELRAFLEGLPEDELEELFRGLFPSGFVDVPVISPRKDDYPQLNVSLVGDTAVGAAGVGAVSGRRWRLGASYAPDLNDTGDSGTLTSTASLEFRQYVPLTRRMNLAYRLFASAAEGNFATPLYIGGLDTVRGFEFRSLVGDRVFFSNLELRFPLIDLLATPAFAFQGIRGVLFLDIAGAWLGDVQSFHFYDSQENRLDDAVASYGYGFTVNFFGLDINVDFAKRWDFKDTLSGFESSLWIGRRF